MTTKSMAYDHSTYITRTGAALGEAGGAGTTGYAKFVAFTSMLAFNAVLTVTGTGTTTAHTVSIQKISGTSTTAIGTATLGTSAVGVTTSIALSTATGGLALAQGDILEVYTGSDAAGKVAVTYEVGVAPLASVTA